MNIYKISALGLSLLAVGCTPEIAEWTPAESPKENKVERAVFKHSVHYPAHAGELSKAERKKLVQFLKEKGSNPFAITVTIEEHGASNEKRVKDLEKVILMHGVPYDLIQVESNAEDYACDPTQRHKKGHAGGVTIIIERYLVIPPSCANFSEKIGDADQTNSGSNYGCSTVANLGMQVANPRDLLRGRTTGDYDGTVLAAGVKRYQTGKITPLIDTSTTVPPGSQAATTATPSSGTTATGGGGAY